MHEIGIVVIGRNEGDRLRASLDSALAANFPLIYVDSGSSDLSCQIAKAKNIPTVELENVEPFTAARARNAGFKQIIDLYPELKYIQFLDGDCQLIEGWIPQGVDYLKNHSQVAIVTGDLHEMEAKESIYNNLCELEWRKEPGELKACGGNFLIK
ncbi:MAG: glycosyltransferase family A protein, partial [Parachlamydiaceae bacterium]